MSLSFLRSRRALLVLVPILGFACGGFHGDAPPFVGGVGGGGFGEGGSFGSGFGGDTATSTGVGPPPMDVCPVGGLQPSACTPTDAACNPKTSLCAAEIDQSSASLFGLRVAQLTIQRPAALTVGIVKTIIEGAALPDRPECNLDGGGTFSWLLRFDTTSADLTIGAAKPLAAPGQSYQFIDEMVPTGSVSFHVAPVTVQSTIAATCAFTSTAGDLVLPVYLDAAAADPILLPLHRLALHDGVISADNGCIGRLNVDGFGCTPDDGHQPFVDGASFDAFFDLEEADTVVVSAIARSLCVVLSGNAAGFGDGAQPVSRCKRGATGNILFKGDWCAATDSPSTPGCADALRFSGTLAASGAAIQ
jgi:hypothetical protein